MTWLILRGPITAGVEMYNNVCILWLDTGSSNYISWSVLGQQLFNYNQPMTNEEMCNSKQFIISEKNLFWQSNLILFNSNTMAFICRLTANLTEQFIRSNPNRHQIVFLSYQ